jgi:hypothetical protein
MATIPDDAIAFSQEMLNTLTDEFLTEPTPISASTRALCSTRVDALIREPPYPRNAVRASGHMPDTLTEIPDNILVHVHDETIRGLRADQLIREPSYPPATGHMLDALTDLREAPHRSYPPTVDETQEMLDATNRFLNRDGPLQYEGAVTGRFTNRTWLNDIAENVDAQQVELLQRITIDYNARRGAYEAELDGYRIHHEVQRGGTQEEDRATRQMLTEQLMQHHNRENDTMATFMDNGTTTTTASDTFHSLFGSPSAPEIDNDPGVFTLQQNTQVNDLTALRNNYPTAVHRYNLQASILSVLHEERQNLRTALATIRRMKAMRHIKQTIPLKYLTAFRLMLESQYTSRERREVNSESLEETRTYMRVIDSIDNYKYSRDQFHTYIRRYSAQQAEYNQKAAMIRQKPSIPTIIDTKALMEELMQWDNVFGVAIKRNMSRTLSIRIGLCNIVMEESAVESRYDNAKPITLAPFYFTLKLEESGNFVCRSDSAYGLSRSNNLAGASYDFHPHQLSDTPCFGTFGQTFVDLAIHGEVAALISGIIAFYSQYNSEDSAGVAARHYHPANLPFINNTESYTQFMSDFFVSLHYHKIHTEKLEHAMLEYANYHAAEHQLPAPVMEARYLCFNCEDENVSDGRDYACANNGERICPSCWENSYCHTCERHEEDCSCEPDY